MVGFGCCRTSNIRHTKFQNFAVSRLVLRLSLRNLLKPCVKSKNEDVVGAAPTSDATTQAMLQLHPSDQQLCCPLRCVIY